MAMFQKAVALTFVMYCGVVECYINNFRFKHSNVFSGDVLPFRVKITGTYYLDVLGTAELSYIKGSANEKTVSAMSMVTNLAPYVCSGDTSAIIAALDSKASKNLTQKLIDLGKIVNGHNKGNIRALMQGWSPYIPIKDVYGCEKLQVVPSVKTDGGFTFTVEHEFNDYKPLIFMDALGVGMFSYKRSFQTRHAGHASGNPIRF